MRTTAAALVLVFAFAVSATAPAAAPPSRIVFSANRAPTVYGEVYLVAANGAVTNLSRSPAADQWPSASPDGTHVAFTSVRGGNVRVYVVGADGRGLRALSPSLGRAIPGGGVVATFAWAPDGRRVAVAVSTGGGPTALYIGSLAGGWRLVARGLDFAAPVWSPDGRRLAYEARLALVRVVDPTGRRLWQVTAERSPAWSQHGLLAVAANSTTAEVYDANGRRVSRFPATAFAWSPTGDTLASARSGGRLELRTNGTGAPVETATFGGRGDVLAVQWATAVRIRVSRAGAAWRTYDVARGRVLPGVQPYASVVSARGVTASVKFGKTRVQLLRGTRVVRTAPVCSDESPFEELQFVGRTDALVYQSGCPLPSGDIYSIAPDGSALRQVTSTPTDEFAPALSPDGTRVAYARQPYADRCDGCAHELWLAPATQLTKHADGEDAPFDDEPMFSPDGTQLAFVRSGPDSEPTLFTIPVAGGAARSLGVAVETAAWGARGIAVARGYDPTTIAIVDPATRATTVLAQVRKLQIAALAWTSDGRLAYLAHDTSGHTSIGILGGGTIRIPLPNAWGLAWSPDGTRFAFVARDANGNGEVWTIGADGSRLQQVTRNLGAVGNLSWR